MSKLNNNKAGFCIGEACLIDTIRCFWFDKGNVDTYIKITDLEQRDEYDNELFKYEIGDIKNNLWL